ncbi:MAG: hypothetical protein RBR08_16675 [Desulforegulaceae bacterium]|nr:hypothetical protein [Desulforegulaceae bacterium]
MCLEFAEYSHQYLWKLFCGIEIPLNIGETTEMTADGWHISLFCDEEKIQLIDFWDETPFNEGNPPQEVQGTGEKLYRAGTFAGYKRVSYMTADKDPLEAVRMLCQRLADRNWLRPAANEEGQP